MRKSTKHANTVPIDLNISGGINLQASSISIAENEAALLQNWMYEKGSDVPIVRPGVNCETATANSDTIILLYHYTNASASKIMCVTDAYDLYYFDTATSAWVDTTVDLNQKPSIITFNQKMLMADGTTTLKTWDGSSGGTQSIDGTIAPSVIAECGNRVVINDTSTGGKDRVCFSKVEDETTWTFTEAGGAVSLRAGYKDGASVVGLVKNFKNELLVFKQGERAETIYRVQTLGAPYESSETAWVAEFVMGGQGISNSHCAESVDTAVIYMGRFGLSALVADEMYSELNTSAIGKKVNAVIGAEGNINYELRYLALSGQLWVLRQGNEIYVYHPHNGAFTTYTFNNSQIYSVVETSDGIYFAGASGHLYSLESSAYRDEYTPSTYSNLTASIKLKDFDLGPGHGVVKFLECVFKPHTQGTVTVYYRENTKTKKTTVATYTEAAGDLDDFMTATLDFMSADDYDFMGVNGFPWTEEIRNKWKGKRWQLQIDTTGRFSLERISGQIAMIGG